MSSFQTTPSHGPNLHQKWPIAGLLGNVADRSADPVMFKVFFSRGSRKSFLPRKKSTLIDKAQAHNMAGRLSIGLRFAVCMVCLGQHLEM